MDELTARAIERERKEAEATIRGYPKILRRCWECGVLFEQVINMPIETWLEWEAQGKPLISGSCPKHEIEDEEDEID